MMSKEAWEQAFDDWERLLRGVNAMSLMDDPKAVWDEAWRAATFTITAMLADKDLAQTIERKMLK